MRLGRGSVFSTAKSAIMNWPILYLVLLLPWSTDNPVATQHIEFHSNSSLSISGSSNVNKFACDCEQPLQPMRIDLQVQPGDQLARFRGAVLELKTRALDCGHKGMNKDMYQTLQADKYPTIEIRLEAVRYQPGYSPEFCSEWVTMLASADLTVAGHTRRVHLEIRGKQTGDDKYRFQSQLPVRMTDFGIEPPTALLGLVKVDDEITINLDLILSASEAG